MDRVPSSLVVLPYLRVQQSIYRVSRGWVGRRLSGAPSLLLTTRGRRSGQDRVRALTYLREGDSWVVVASNGGSDRSPAWLLNLIDHPEVHVQDGRAHHDAIAHVADEDERARLWPLVNRNNRGFARVVHRGAAGRYDVYQQRTEREVPIVVIEPTTDADAASATSPRAG
jgi:deazaflavin-dependent oxidoreductase (nitroreductase family)